MTLIIFYSRSGVTEKAADIIKEVKGGDLFKVETVNDYSGKMGYMKAFINQIGGKEQELKGLPNLDNYSVIYVGGPTWNYKPSGPILSLLSKVDFQNKTVIPFLTNGGNSGDYFKEFKEKAKNANIVHEGELIKADRISDEELRGQIMNWLKTIE